MNAISGVIIDEDYRDRRLENRLNAVVRHCKIGKFTWKRPASIPSMWPAEIFKPWTPITPSPVLQPNTIKFMPKCGCRVGTPCGMSACPHAPVVTC